MTISARAVAVQGIGFSTLLVALQGFGSYVRFTSHRPSGVFLFGQLGNRDPRY